MSTEKSGMAARLRQIEESARAALAQRQEQLAPDPAIEQLPAPTRVLVPVPRRARMFVLHGAGHGEFSDVTLTGPVRGSQAAPA